jgi:hypothetical protein
MVAAKKWPVPGADALLKRKRPAFLQALVSLVETGGIEPPTY